MADEEFKKIGLSPSHAFVLKLTIENPGIGPKELSEKLHLAPSTVTRFVDLLVNRKMVSRNIEGKSVRLFSTKKGEEMGVPISTAWNSLYERYSSLIGKKRGDELAKMISDAADLLGE